jgi:hypothetical protein
LSSADPAGIAGAQLSRTACQCIVKVSQRLAAAVQVLRANIGGRRYLPIGGRRGGRMRVSVLVSITLAGQLAGNA